MSFLLDANILIALIDTAHSHHESALRFFPKAQKAGWMTCPLVENAFIRIFGRPEYRNGPGAPNVARQLLVQYRAAPGHRFLPDDLSLCDNARFPSLPGSMALTDLYLLALAAKHGCRFATFDQGIDASLVPGGGAAYYCVPNSTTR